MNSSRSCMTEGFSKDLLRKYFVPVPLAEEYDDAQKALTFARKIGYPVVLKVSHADLAHKSDIGGVVLNVQSDDALNEAVSRLLRLREGARVRVEKQAEDGVADLILGFKRDPVFGLVLMLGLGGIFAEIFSDASLYVGVPTRAEARSMYERLKGRAILEGARGRKRADLDAVASAVTSLAALAVENPDIAEMDINPLRVYDSGVLALDALAVHEKAQASKTAKRTETAFDRVNPLFCPKSTAVVGPSTNAEKAGNIILKNLKTLGYKGKVFPVNPSGAVIEGLQSYPTVSDCPEPPETAVLAVPYHQVEKVVADVAAGGTRHVIIASGGFSDAGDEGRAREKSLLDFCAANGVHVMGPNSIGTVNAHSGFATTIGKLPPMPPSGICIFGQSGTLSTGFALEEITARRRGFAKIACLGNKADIDESDFLEYFADDLETKCLGIYIESVKDGPRFIEAARRASERKPVVILKSGRTELGARAAASHTGALAGSDAVYDAVFRQAGLLRVSDFKEFFDTLRTFDLCPVPAGRRLGVVSITGVGCVLAADACGATGMTIAAIKEETHAAMKALVPAWATIGNPADIWSTIEQRGPAEAYRRMCEIMLADEGVDILLLIVVLLEEGAFDAAAALAPVKAAHPQKPILACHLGGKKEYLESFQVGLEGIGIPVFQGPEEAIRAAARLAARKK